MKKFRVLIFALLFAFSGLALALPSFVFGWTPNADQTEQEEIKPDYTISNKDTFETVMGQQENFSKYIVLANDIDFEGSTIDTSIASFTGIFDGNGFALKNFVITSQSSSIGLFSNVQGGTIKNLKLEGNDENKFVFDLSNQKDDQLYIGLLVGRGSNATIENCEIGEAKIYGSTEQFSTVCDSVSSEDASELTKLSASTKFTFGGIAGYLNTGSLVANSLTYLQGNFETTLAGTPDARAPIQVGGIVGMLDNSRIDNVASFVKFNFSAPTQYVDFFAGGLASELSNASVQYYTIRNSISFATLENLQGSFGTLVGGALVGRISAANAGEKVCFNYYSNTLAPVGRNLSGSALNSSNATISALNTSFWSNARWYDTSSPWDFDLVWHWEVGERLHLQRFLMFDLSFAGDINSEFLSEPEFVGRTPDQNDVCTCKYDDEINLKIEFTADCVGYYELKEIYRDSYPIDREFVDKIAPERNKQNDITGYIITFKVSDMTKGAYSFECEANQFRYEVEVADGQTGWGGVRMQGGQGQPKQNLSPSPIEKGVKQSIEAVETGEAAIFDHWELETYDVSANGYVKLEDFDERSIKSQPVLEFTFGQNIQNEPDNDIFTSKLCVGDHPFKLVAYFTEDRAINIKFNKYDQTKITKVKFNGHEYTGDAIKISPKATNVELEITVREGYVFDVDQFITYMKTRYSDVSLLERNYSVIEEDGQMVYRFANINMERITSLSQPFIFELHSKIVEKDDENNLTWLWITIGVVGGVLLIGIILTIILVHRRNVKRRFEQKNGTYQKQGKVKKKKVKEPNYRDYYG